MRRHVPHQPGSWESLQINVTPDLSYNYYCVIGGSRTKGTKIINNVGLKKKEKYPTITTVTVYGIIRFSVRLVKEKGKNVIHTRYGAVRGKTLKTQRTVATPWQIN